ncbi:MAG: hypothetical protein JJ975_13565 [Bacteroidia bacterium]|nr:hypothetical protein [Bacteroidia bacterium]
MHHSFKVNSTLLLALFLVLSALTINNAHFGTNYNEDETYRKVRTFRLSRGGRHLVVNDSTKKYGIVTDDDSIVVPLIYDKISGNGSSLHGLCRVWVGEKVGVISLLSGNELIPPIYLKMDHFPRETYKDQYVWAKDTTGHYGVLDSNNTVLVDFEHGEQTEGAFFHKNLGVFRKEGLQGMLHVERGEIIPPIYHYLQPSFHDGYILYIENQVDIRRNGRTHHIADGYIDKNFNKHAYGANYGAYTDWEVSNAPGSLIAALPKVLRYKGDSTVVDYQNLLNNSLNALFHVPRSSLSNKAEYNILTHQRQYQGWNDSAGFNGYAFRKFSKEYTFKILSSESLRESAWSWISPYMKKCFKSLHAFHKKKYKALIRSLRDYINRYDLEKVKQHLANNEKQFAYTSWESETNAAKIIRPYGAKLDRLIVYHKLISVKDAKRWLNRIAREMETW